MILEAVASFLVTPSWIAICVGLLSTLYIYLRWTFGYWEKQGVKCDKPWIILGTYKSLLKKQRLEYQDVEAFNRHGKVFGIYEGRYPALVVADPDLLRTILVKDFHVFPNRRTFPIDDDKYLFRYFLSTMEGEEWKALRNIITPTFTTGKMKQMVNLMEECAKQFVGHLRKRVENDEAINAKEWFSSYTMDVIATCAFGTKIDSMEDKDNEFVKEAKHAFGDPPKWIFFIFTLPVFLQKHMMKKFMGERFDYLAEFVKQVMKARQIQKQPRRDFLQILLEAKKENEKENNSNQSSEPLKDKLSSPKMVLKDIHIIAQVVLFLVAGFETTSITLSFLIYNLLLNDDVQMKLINEIDEMLEKHNNVVSYEMIAEMDYLDMVISETLRMCPPVGRLERVCEQDDYKLNNITLKKRDTIIIPVYCIHHAEEFYPNPSKFDPERFSTENRQKRSPYVYLPFGYGPRNCVGLRFALMQAKIGLIYLLKEYRVKICSETQIPFKTTMSIFLQPEVMNFKLEKRSEVSS